MSGFETPIVSHKDGTEQKSFCVVNLSLPWREQRYLAFLESFCNM